MQAKLEFDHVTQSLVGRPTIPATKAVYEKRLKKDPNYDSSKDLATHGFNVLVCGLTVRWKNLLGVHFTDVSFDEEITANFIRQCIHECTAIGLKIRSVTMDSAANNQAL